MVQQFLDEVLSSSAQTGERRYERERFGLSSIRSLRSKKIFVSAKKMLACGGFWLFTASRSRKLAPENPTSN